MRAVVIILTRLTRVACGNFGLVRSVGDGVSEIKIDYGPGFRIYYATRGKQAILLLIGGDKRTQKKDIEKAKEFWIEYQGREKYEEK